MDVNEAIDQIGRAAASVNEAASAVDTLHALGYVKATDGRWRAESKASFIAGGGPVDPYQRGGYYEPSRVFTPPGSFLRSVMLSRSRDTMEQAEGKATLDGYGIHYEEPDSFVKATLGTTDATGGWIVPNALVADIAKVGEYVAPVLKIVTRITGVNAATVDLPFRSAAPTAAAIQTVGSAKENSDLVYNGYTATMYTLARIYDLSRQFVRNSSGAAEQDVLTELAHSLALGQSSYLFTGTGSSQPYGLLTALTASPATFTSSFSPATTLAGSVITAIATCVTALASRNRTNGLTAVMSPTSYGQMITQGDNAAGFYFSGMDGAQNLPGFDTGTPVVFGVPVIADASMSEDRLVVGQFKALRVYYGQSYRVDSSDVAGSRWDNNLVGFRGELDFALDARPAVYSGAFQQITNLVP